MITGELKSKIDRVWDAFWSGGISNPLEVIEQITYLLFIRRLDDLQTLAESKSRNIGNPIDDSIFPPDKAHLRWSTFKNDDPEVMHKLVSDEVFPFLRGLGGDGSTYSEHMRDARFTIPTPALLSKVVDMLDGIPMVDRDTNGDLYEYLLSKIASAGVNGQFRTPRHIIKLMVDMVSPQPTDEICDPACGTAGFLVAASEYIRDKHPSALTNATQRQHFHRSMFHGYDFDSTMLRIGSMNMLLHGIEAPDIRYRDSLSEGASDDSQKYTLILANPPFAGSLDYESTSKDLQRVVKTKKTELLFVALFLKLLKPGGRAAVIVPDGVLFGSSKAHKDLRRSLVEDQKLDAVVKLPSGVFRPYAGVSTAILFFTKTNSGGTDDVWFYDVQADGFSLDDKRNPAEANDLPDALTRWAGSGPRSTTQKISRRCQRARNSTRHWRRARRRCRAKSGRNSKQRSRYRTRLTPGSWPSETPPTKRSSQGCEKKSRWLRRPTSAPTITTTPRPRLAICSSICSWPRLAGLSPTNVIVSTASPECQLLWARARWTMCSGVPTDARWPLSRQSGPPRARTLGNSRPSFTPTVSRRSSADVR